MRAVPKLCRGGLFGSNKGDNNVHDLLIKMCFSAENLHEALDDVDSNPLTWLAADHMRGCRNLKCAGINGWSD